MYLLYSTIYSNVPRQIHPQISKRNINMNPNIKQKDAKAQEHNKLPSSKATQATGVQDATTLEASGTTSVVEVGSHSGAGEITERRKNQKGPQKETREGNPKAVDAGTSVPAKRSHYDCILQGISRKVNV